MGMLQFLKVLKLIKALEWFDEGISNVSEVVYRLGYESVSTFSNTFNEVLGYRPQVYLQNRKQMHAVKTTHEKPATSNRNPPL
jgi:AraC-like DNA-binding protein